MHFFSASIIATAATLSCVSGVTVQNYRGPNCKGNFAECASQPQLSCCTVTPSGNSQFTSALFKGLPTTAIGNICGRGGKPDACGSTKKSGSGLSLCVAATSSTGSFWFDCNSRKSSSCGKNKRDTENIESSFISAATDVNTTDSSLANVLGFDGHRFPIHYDTPQHVTEILVQLFIADASYKDIPQELLEYEILESDEENA